MAQGGGTGLSPTDQVHDERRTRTRYPCVFEGHARPISMPDGWWPAKVRNVSARGIMLFLDRRFEPGTILTLELDDPIKAGSISMLVRVLWPKVRCEGGWLHGCTLGRELSDDDLQTLVRSFKQTPALVPA